ncbi:MAG: 1-deoxy-D-xylulose-5-phosphate reductoisomerase, partial [Alphaproteobacteria bacterium]
IEILVHPQSIIHSMVAYIDGSVLAQLGTPDMRTPISYALAWPRRMTSPSTRLDLGEIATLTFESPDSERFPALRLAREALKTGGSAPTILNASNEVAVAGFLGGNLGFLDIPRVVEETLEKIPASVIGSVDDVLS